MDYWTGVAMVNEDGNAAKDTLQVVTESAADHLGKIAGILTTAVKEIARELGEWFNDVVEMREQGQRDKGADEDV